MAAQDGADSSDGPGRRQAVRNAALAALVRPDQPARLPRRELSIAIASQEPDPEAELRRKRLMHPIPRAGRLEEVAALAVHLASDESAFTTGQAFAVDGGYTIR